MLSPLCIVSQIIPVQLEKTMRITRLAVLALLSVSIPNMLTAQVNTLGHDHGVGGVEHASCSGCDSCSGGYVRGQAIWGTYCIESCHPGCGKPGLFPPTPNPCGSPLGGLLLDLRCAVDSSVSNVLGAILGPPCNACGSSSCDSSCGVPVDGCSDGCSDCASGSIEFHQPTPVDASMAPEELPKASGDPFTDDDPQARRSNRSSGRGLLYGAQRFRPSLMKGRVRKVNHVQASTRKVATTGHRVQRQQPNMQSRVRQVSQEQQVSSSKQTRSILKTQPSSHYKHPKKMKMRTVNKLGI